MINTKHINNSPLNEIFPANDELDRLVLFPISACHYTGRRQMTTGLGQGVFGFVLMVMCCMRPAIRALPLWGTLPQSSLCGYNTCPQVLLPLTFLKLTGIGGSSPPTHVIFNPNMWIVLFDVVFNNGFVVKWLVKVIDQSAYQSNIEPCCGITTIQQKKNKEGLYIAE